MQGKGRRKPLFFGLDDMTSQDRADSESAAHLEGIPERPRHTVRCYNLRFGFSPGARHVRTESSSFRRPLQAINPSRVLLGGRHMAFGRHWM